MSGLSVGDEKNYLCANAGQIQSTLMFCIIGKVLFVAKITATQPVAVVRKRALLRQTFQRASRMPCMPVGVLEGKGAQMQMRFRLERRGEAGITVPSPEYPNGIGNGLGCGFPVSFEFQPLPG